MLWIDLIDIAFLLVGVILGFIICRSVIDDVDDCSECEYREMIRELIEYGEE